MRAKSEKANSFYYKRDRLNQLRGFCAVVQNDCSLIKASEKLGLEKPAISKQISALERDLGIELFDRKGKILKLNENGKSFYELSQPSLEQIDGVFKSFTKALEYTQKTLNIATNPVIFKKILPFLHKFSCGFKNIKINISFLEQEKALKKLLDNEIDIFISSKENYENIKYGLSFVKMIDYIPYWVLYKNHPLANKKQLLKEDIIKSDLLFNEESITMPTFKSFILDNNLKSFISINNSDIDLWKILIKYEYGIALIFNTFLSKDDCSNFILKNAENLFPKGEYGYYIKTMNHKNVLKDFCNILDQNVKNLFFV